MRVLAATLLLGLSLLHSSSAAALGERRSAAKAGRIYALPLHASIAAAGGRLGPLA